MHEKEDLGPSSLNKRSQVSHAKMQSNHLAHIDAYLHTCTCTTHHETDSYTKHQASPLLVCRQERPNPPPSNSRRHLAFPDHLHPSTRDDAPSSPHLQPTMICSDFPFGSVECYTSDRKRVSDFRLCVVRNIVCDGETT